MRKKKRTTESRTGCVTTRCCVECPRPSRRRRRRQVASKSLPLSRAMPMPLPALQNIMPSPFMPLNIPLPRVEQNRRPYGTHQKNNQPFRTQQELIRNLGAITDTLVRGLTNQKAPITNVPNEIPPPRLTNPRLGRGPSPGRKMIGAALSPTPRQTLKTKGSPLTPRMEDKLPNALDLQGQNALGVSNQGENLRVNPLVGVTRNEILREKPPVGVDINEYMEMEEADLNSRGGFDIGRGMNMIRYRKGERGFAQDFANPVSTPQPVYTPQPERPNLGRVGTPSPPVDRPTLSRVASSGLAARLASNDPFSKLDVFGSGGAGARMASDTTTEISN